jgi:hypothetical protein
MLLTLVTVQETPSLLRLERKHEPLTGLLIKKVLEIAEACRFHVTTTEEVVITNG